MFNRTVGSDNVGSLLNEGVITKALIDTGSQISTVSEAFLKEISVQNQKSETRMS